MDCSSRYRRFRPWSGRSLHKERLMRIAFAVITTCMLSLIGMPGASAQQQSGGYKLEPVRYDRLRVEEERCHHIRNPVRRDECLRHVWAERHHERYGYR